MLLFFSCLEKDKFQQPKNIKFLGYKITALFNIPKSDGNGPTDLAKRYRGISLTKSGERLFEQRTRLPLRFVQY